MHSSNFFLSLPALQVYQNVIHSMMIYDEKRYPSACVEPPVPREGRKDVHGGEKHVLYHTVQYVCLYPAKLQWCCSALVPKRFQSSSIC